MYIKGVGCTKFGIGSESSVQMVHNAVVEALDNAQMSMKEIDLAVISNMDLFSNGERQRHSSSMLSSLFQTKFPIISVPAGCQGGGIALWTALQLSKGENQPINNVLVVGFEKIVANVSKKIIDEILMGGERIYEQSEGLNFPAQNALVAQQYMLKYGATMDDLALIAFKNHQNAYKNPKARFYKKEVTLKQIKKSPVVASPLRLFDCSISANGAAAVVLSKEKTDIQIIGKGFCVDRISAFESEDMTTWPATKIAAEQAFAQAKLTPSQIDVAEIHDAFTSVELISYEDLGFAKPGEGANLIRDGITNLEGKFPVNTGGGLKAKGHPISATGMSQIYELTKQLRGEAGERQVQCKYALAQNIGGAGSTVSVHILRKV